MRRYDMSPLLRSTIGFDHLSRLLDSAFTAEDAPSYPPYNIEKLSEDDYRISLAVAGFKPDELSVTVEDGTLIIIGRSAQNETEEDRSFLHRGIATRAFERRFELADTIRVGEARMEHGLLQVNLQREIPEHKRPRTIEIHSGETAGTKTIEAAA